MESLGGNILTMVSQHMLSLPKSVVAIGDFNSNVRILVIPDTLSTPQENETEVNLISNLFRCICSLHYSFLT